MPQSGKARDVQPKVGLYPHLRSVLSGSPWGLGFPQGPPLQRDERPQVQAAGIGECQEKRCSHAAGPEGLGTKPQLFPEAVCVSLKCHPRNWVPPLEGRDVPCGGGGPPGPLVTGVSVGTLSRAHSPCAVLTRQGDGPGPVCQGQRRPGWKPRSLHAVLWVREDLAEAAAELSSESPAVLPWGAATF